VRHPFERLLSAFRDKLENKNIGLEHGVEHFYMSYGRKIVQKYRNDSSKRLEPTFPEFVTYLIKEDPIRYNVENPLLRKSFDFLFSDLMITGFHIICFALRV
jgi:hypothetical protein